MLNFNIRYIDNLGWSFTVIVNSNILLASLEGQQQSECSWCLFWENVCPCFACLTNQFKPMTSIYYIKKGHNCLQRHLCMFSFVKLLFWSDFYFDTFRGYGLIFNRISILENAKDSQNPKFIKLINRSK